MGITCGVTIGVNNLKGELDTRINAILDLDLGTPEGLDAIADSIEGTLSDIADKVAGVVVIPPALKSLRGELAELAALPFAGLAAAAKIVSIAADYAGLTDIRGYANLNLTDLAKSVFNIEGTFDPCSASIPNISLDPSGIIQELPAIQPPFGSTLAGLKVFAPDRQIIDNLGEAIKDNIPLVPSSLPSSLPNIETINSALESGAATVAENTPALVEALKSGATTITENTPALTAAAQKEVATAKTTLVAAAQKEVKIAKIAIESNVATSITGMGDMVKKLPNGEEVVETKSDFVERVKYNSLPIMDEEQIPPSPEDIIEARVKNARPAIGFEGDTTARDNFDKTFAPLIRAGCPVGPSGLPDRGCLDTPEEAEAKEKKAERVRERHQRLRKIRRANSKLPPAERKSTKEIFAEFYALPENDF